jgi:hypothetical protein
LSPALPVLFALQRGIDSAGWFHTLIERYQIVTVIIDRNGAAARGTMPGIDYFLIRSANSIPSPKDRAGVEARFPDLDDGGRLI